MKKKGRICGTIGLILSLALAGGTVVYGTMFHGNTVGKAEKLVGSSTGTVFDGWFKHTGFDETKALVDQTVGLAKGNAATEGGYSSYSLSFNYSSMLSVKVNDKETVMQGTAAGVVYTDAAYTYVKYTTRTIDDRATTVESSEYVLVKETGAVYTRTNPSPYTETPGDSMFSDVSTWKYSGETFDVPGFLDLTEVFASISTDNKVYITPTGEYKFNGPVLPEGAEGVCKFTVGYCPTIRYTMTTTGTKEAGGDSTTTVALQYSNLNNTKIELPASLTEVII